LTWTAAAAAGLLAAPLRAQAPARRAQSEVHIPKDGKDVPQPPKAAPATVSHSATVYEAPHVTHLMRVEGGSSTVASAATERAVEGRGFGVPWALVGGLLGGAVFLHVVTHSAPGSSAVLISGGTETTPVVPTTTPSTPSTPSTPTVPSTPAVPSTPVVPSAPVVPGLPSAPSLPLIPAGPLMPEVPEIPLVPSTPEIPLTAPVLTAPESPAVTATPEPPSPVLLATGLLGVFGAARRRRIRAQLA
jgi:MYXO-CTERM domain-containing protein